MTDAGFFRGTSAEQDNRFSDKEKKLLKQMRFGENVTKKVDMSKVKVEALKPWITKRVEDLLGMEDDVIEEFVINQLEANQFPDGRRIQINLTGFLNGKNARIFTTELWDMLLSAQEQTSGIPATLIESKQEEIRKRNEEQAKLSETLKRTVSRFTDKLKTERDSSPPSSSKQSSSGSHIKKERGSPDSSRDLDSSSRRKDDGSRRQYRTRRSPSRSPSRKSRSRSRSRDRDRRAPDTRRDRDRDRTNRDRSRDRRRERSRSPIQIRRRSRSPPPARDSSARTQRDRSRDRSGPIGNRRFSDHNNDRRRKSRSKSPREDSSRAVRSQGENGSQLKPPSSSTPPQVEKNERKQEEKIVEEVKNMEIEKEAAKGKSSPSGDDQSNEDSAPEDQVKKAKKEKKAKKDKKKHKKHHKKSKKAKKAKVTESGNEDEDNGNGEEDMDAEKSGGDSESDPDSDDKTAGDKSKLASSFLKLVDSTGGKQNSEDLEKKLREKALESLKKAGKSEGQS